MTETIYRKGVFIMKKAEKVLYTVFKVIFAITAIAIVITYLRELFGPTVAQPLVTSNDWFTLGYMSCVFVLITEREKKIKALPAEDN